MNPELRQKVYKMKLEHLMVPESKEVLKEEQKERKKERKKGRREGREEGRGERRKEGRREKERKREGGREGRRETERKGHVKKTWEPLDRTPNGQSWNNLSYKIYNDSVRL